MVALIEVVSVDTTVLVRSLSSIKVSPASSSASDLLEFDGSLFGDDVWKAEILQHINDAQDFIRAHATERNQFEELFWEYVLLLLGFKRIFSSFPQFSFFSAAHYLSSWLEDLPNDEDWCAASSELLDVVSSVLAKYYRKNEFLGKSYQKFICKGYRSERIALQQELEESQRRTASSKKPGDLFWTENVLVFQGLLALLEDKILHEETLACSWHVFAPIVIFHLDHWRLFFKMQGLELLTCLLSNYDAIGGHPTNSRKPEWDHLGASYRYKEPLEWAESLLEACTESMFFEPFKYFQRVYGCIEHLYKSFPFLLQNEFPMDYIFGLFVRDLAMSSHPIEATYVTLSNLIPLKKANKLLIVYC